MDEEKKTRCKENCHIGVQAEAELWFVSVAYRLKAADSWSKKFLC